MQLLQQRCQSRRGPRFPGQGTGSGNDAGDEGGQGTGSGDNAGDEDSREPGSSGDIDRTGGGRLGFVE